MSNYQTTTLVSRPGYSSTGGLSDLLGKAWGFVSGGEKAKGQAELLKAQAAAKKAAGGGLPPWLPLVAIGGLALYLYTRKK
jgi:hypothetical protein